MRLLFLKLLLFLLLSRSCRLASAEDGPPLRLIAVPVGAGDCSVIVFPTGALMMIDTGTDEAFRDVVLPFLQRHCVDHLDYLVLSHNHPDHVGGVPILRRLGFVDSETVVWDANTFSYGDRFDVEKGVDVFVYNARDVDYHGADPNHNSLSLRFQYRGWVYTTGGDEGLASMRRFAARRPGLVRAHVRKVAHHLWGPLSVPFLRRTDAHLYIVPNEANIVGMAPPWDAWDATFKPKVIDWLRANGGRVDDPGYAVTGEVGFVSVRVHDATDWDYRMDEYDRRRRYTVDGWTRCPRRTPGALFVAQSVPRYVAVGARVRVSVRFSNAGTTTWSEANGVRLMSRRPKGNRKWGTNRARLPPNQRVRRGRDHTFTFEITAPANLGTYDFQWQMVDEGPNGGAGVFGEPSPVVRIVVVKVETCSCVDRCRAARCDFSTRPPTMRPTTHPTDRPTDEPTVRPTNDPTYKPTDRPTGEPTSRPTKYPTKKPTDPPTDEPTARQTNDPTKRPTDDPTEQLTNSPTTRPPRIASVSPSMAAVLSVTPSVLPTSSVAPTESALPTVVPTASASPSAISAIVLTTTGTDKYDDVAIVATIETVRNETIHGTHDASDVAVPTVFVDGSATSTTTTSTTEDKYDVVAPTAEDDVVTNLVFSQYGAGSSSLPGEDNNNRRYHRQ